MVYLKPKPKPKINNYPDTQKPPYIVNPPLKKKKFKKKTLTPIEGEIAGLLSEEMYLKKASRFRDLRWKTGRCLKSRIAWSIMA